MCLSANNASAYAAPGKNGAACKQSIDAVVRYIRKKGGMVAGIKMEKREQSPYGSEYAGLYVSLETKPEKYMPGRATGLQDATNNIIAKSPLTMLPYAKKIIDACDSVVRVVIHHHEEGSSYSIHPDGQVLIDRCATPGMGYAPQWGYTNCI